MLRCSTAAIFAALLWAVDAAAQNPARDALRASEQLAPGPPRWFVASSVDLGYKYVRPRLNLGRGVPFGQWIGVDLNPLVSSFAVGGYGGIRIASPVVNLRSGAMYVVSFDRSFLPIRPSYDRHQSETRVDDESAKYWAFTTEMTLNIPVAGGNLNSETETLGVVGVPKDRYVFVDTLSVVAAGVWVLRQRLAYTYPAFGLPGLMVGGGGEVLVLPERDELVWRAGPLARWWLSETLGARFALMPVVASPDSLGLIGAEFELGIRWLWEGISTTPGSSN